MKHLGTKRIETERLILRRFTVEDAKDMYENWASDEEVTKYLMWLPHASVEATSALLERWVEGYQEDTKYEWCIQYKESGQAIGSIGVAKIVERAELMEIGYCISRTCWNQGITSEALQAVMKYLFDEVGVNRVEARHDPRNPHSGNVLKKCGMKYEGTKVQGDWNNSGICDIAFYGLTKSQRQKSKESLQITKTKVSNRHTITDETIEYIGILAKLELSEAEKEQAKKDMEEMLCYIDKLNELDTEGVEPLSHVFPVSNVFREDIVENTDAREQMLWNAPEVKDGSYKVPKTVE